MGKEKKKEEGGRIDTKDWRENNEKPPSQPPIKEKKGQRDKKIKTKDSLFGVVILVLIGSNSL
jgi:hypothetical protein